MLPRPLAHRLLGPNEPLVFRLAQCLPWYRGAYVSDARPIIVGGCGRSGTTLMRVILDTHDRVCCGPETNLLSCWRPRRFFANRLSRHFDIDRDEIRRMMSESATHAQFVERFFRLVCLRNGADVWAEKTPRNVHALPYILRHFPRARFVHIIRDGRDTVCSLRKHPRFRQVDGRSVPTNIDNPLPGCVRRWVRDVGVGLRYRDDPRYHEIRYEQLVQRPEDTLRGLFEFLELEWQAQVLDFHRVRTDSRDVSRFPQNPEAAGPIHRSAIGRWRKDLTAEQQRYVLQHAGPLLSRLGYLDA